MSMSTSIIGIKPPDEKWKKMKAIWDACEAAGIEVPDEVDEFFNGNDPDALGVCVELDDYHEGPHESVIKLEGKSGYEVDLHKLPEGIRYIRFENRW